MRHIGGIESTGVRLVSSTTASDVRQVYSDSSPNIRTVEELKESQASIPSTTHTSRPAGTRDLEASSSSLGADTKGKVTLKPSMNSIFGAGSIREARATAKVEHYMAGIPLREGIDELLKPSPQETVPDTSDEERELGGRPRPCRGAGW